MQLDIGNEPYLLFPLADMDFSSEAWFLTDNDMLTFQNVFRV